LGGFLLRCLPFLRFYAGQWLEDVLMIIPSLRHIITPAGHTVIPGSVGYTTPGTYSFTVPYYHSLLADCRGASGGGGGYCWNQPYGGTDGGAGGYSYFNAPSGNIVGYGGGGGTAGSSQQPVHHG